MADPRNEQMLVAKMNWAKKKYGDRFMLRALSMDQIIEEVPAAHWVCEMARVLHNHAVQHAGCVMTYEEIGALLRTSDLFPAGWDMLHAFVREIRDLLDLGVIVKEGE